MNILLQLFSFCLGKYREVKLLGQRLGACLQETASLFYSGLGWMGQCSPALVRGIFFPQSIDLNAHLFWKHPHRHAQNNVLTATLSIISNRNEIECLCVELHISPFLVVEPTYLFLTAHLRP